MSAPLKVLIVEDSADDTELLLHELRRGGFDPQWKRVDTDGGMRAALDEEAWDIIISDFTIPRFGAPAALEILKESGLDIPFIVTSGVISIERAVPIMRAGAKDFVDKNNLVRLVPAVQRELKEMEQHAARQGAEARLRTVIDTVADGIITIDEAGTIHSFSSIAEDIFGYTADELIGKNVKILMPEPHRGRHDGYIANYLRTGKGKVMGIGREVEGMRKDGTVIPIALSIGRVSLGDRYLFTGVVRDITARKRAERSLRESEESFKTLVESYPSAMLISRVSDEKILFGNSHFQKLVGIPSEKLSGLSAKELFSDPMDHSNILSLLRQNGQVLNYKLKYKRGDGTSAWGLASVQQMKLGGDQVLMAAIKELPNDSQSAA